MNEEIINMAKKSGWSYMEAGLDKQRLEAFAKLVIADARDAFSEQEMDNIHQAIKIEREGCAKLCDDLTWEGPFKSAAIAVANLIRSRK